GRSSGPLCSWRFFIWRPVGDGSGRPPTQGEISCKSAVHKREDTMSVARVTEITSSSPKSFDDALRVGLSRANKTLQNVTGAWIKDQEVLAKNGTITEFRVRMKISFLLKD